VFDLRLPEGVSNEQSDSSQFFPNGWCLNGFPGHVTA
jgi:hypothetical protein